MTGKLLRMKAVRRLKRLMNGTHELHGPHTFCDEDIELMVDTVLEEMDIDIGLHKARHFSVVIKFNTGAIEDVAVFKYATVAVKYREMMDRGQEDYEGENVQYIVSPGHNLITKLG